MLVKEVYQDSLVYEESALAHYLHHLLTEKKISLEDDIDHIDLEQADHQKVAQMIHNNFLGFHRINIYSLKMNEKDFVFIFAGSTHEAIHYFEETLHQSPWNCHEYPLDFQLVRGKEVFSFRDMKKGFESFPAIAGYFKREW
ncbi:hypothetical protein ACWM35_10325 [Neobacillus sp. K501]